MNSLSQLSLEIVMIVISKSDQHNYSLVMPPSKMLLEKHEAYSKPYGLLYSWTKTYSGKAMDKAVS